MSQIKDKDLNRKICMITGNYLRNAKKTAKTLTNYDWKKKTALIKKQFGLKIKIRKNKKNIYNKY